MVIYHLGGKVRDNKLSVCFLIFCFTHSGGFVNITKFKVPVLPLCHLIVPENGWRIVCSGLKKAAASAGSLGAENQYCPPFSTTKLALGAYGKVKGISFVICLPSCLQFAYTHTIAAMARVPPIWRIRHYVIVSNIYNRVKNTRMEFMVELI